MLLDSILDIKNLNKAYKKGIFSRPLIAVRDLSCNFPAGKCTGLMGANGAGKTTTIKSILGLLKIDSGEICFKGKPIDYQDKKSIGYMPETNKLPRNLTCHEVLRNQLKIYKGNSIKRKRLIDEVDQKLKEVQLWEQRNKRVSDLSKGMARRLAWAQACIHEPDLLILDEPFSGLDPDGRLKILDLIKGLKSKKVSIILCTHELWSVDEVCDELYILRSGQVAYSSIKPVKGQRKTAFYNYQIISSGTELASIEHLQKKLGLPEWDDLYEKELLLRFGFGEYSDAMCWLNALTNHGVIILNFSKPQHFPEDELLGYFRKEEI